MERGSFYYGGFFMLKKQLEEILHDIVKLNQKIMDTCDYSNLISLCEQDISIIHLVGENENISAKDISEILHAPKTTIVSAVDRLCRKKYLTKESDPKDRRRMCLSLTDLGQKANGEHNTYEEQILEFLVNQFEKEDQEELSKILERRKR